MVSSNDWGHVNTFSQLTLIEDARTVYTFHFYEPLLFTHQNAPWVSFMKMLEGLKVPYPGPFDHSILDIKTGFPMDFGFMKSAPYGPQFLESLLEPVIQFKNKNKVPVYCGEFGSVVWAPGTTASIGTGTLYICLSSMALAFQIGTIKAMISGL